MNALDHALRLAARNIPCFFCNIEKRPTTPNGFKDAVTDETALRQLYRRYGGALVGMPTGTASGISVVDLDFGKRPVSREWFEKHRDRLPETTTHVTKSGGLHLLYRHVDGVKNREGRLFEGVETRGTGGYIVWWPSNGCEVQRRGSLAPWPAWLSQALWPPKPARPPPHPTRPLRPGEAATRAQTIVLKMLFELETARDGQRHALLRRAACVLGGLLDELGISEAEAERLLLEAVIRAGAEDHENAARTARWGIERGRQTPLVMGASR